jgi:hypothetical protein
MVITGVLAHSLTSSVIIVSLILPLLVIIVPVLFSPVMLATWIEAADNGGGRRAITDGSS